MALQANANMTFNRYVVEDDGIRLWFVCSNPGGGEPSDYTIFFTDAELSAITTQVQLRSAVITKLQRAYRATNIATKLDQFIGQSVTI